MTEEFPATDAQETDSLTRRGVIAAGAGGLAVGGLGAVGAAEAAPTLRAVARTPGVLDLYINDGFVPMVDGSLVYMRGYGERPTTRDDTAPSLTITPRVFLADGRLVKSRSYPLDAALPPNGRPEPDGAADPTGNYRIRRAHWASYFPRRTIVAESGSRVRIRVHNGLKQKHELTIFGTGSTGPIPPGGTGKLSFRANVPGTFLYSDTRNPPVERVLGLHGVLLVVPRNDQWRLTPGGIEFERQWVWLCQTVDPVWARRAQDGRRIDPDVQEAVPRYFMINDRSGYQALALSGDEALNHERHEDTLLSGFPRKTDVRDFSKPDGRGSIITGQLVRMVNAGLATHQMHFHGNHVWTVSRNGQTFPRTGGRVEGEGRAVLQTFEDVVRLNPLEIKDIVHPLKRPPEVLDEVWDARAEDWNYPMHCHAELSQTAAGGLYPGGLIADWCLAHHGAAEKSHETFSSQVAMASSQPRQGSPETEFRQQPDRSFVRKFFNRRLSFPDGSEHEIWSFEDETSGRGFPAPLMRVTEGEIVHTLLKPAKGPHTIHLHGIEPDPRNDGVGHTSFEVTGGYTYQWRPSVGIPGDPNIGAAGTYFYHCHVNTVLHVQMGMAGPLIIDPVVHPDFPPEPGARRTYVDGPLYDIETETLLAPYSIDPRWHELSHAAGLSGEDVGLHVFEAKHFFVLGGSIAAGPPTGAVWAPTEVRANLPGSGRPTLLRVVNLNYFPTRLRFTTESGVPVSMAEPIAHDGRAFRDTSDRRGRCPPARERGRSRLTTNVLTFGGAERYDMLIHPPKAGNYLVHMDWYNWVPRTVRRPIATRVVPLVAS